MLFDLFKFRSERRDRATLVEFVGAAQQRFAQLEARVQALERVCAAQHAEIEALRREACRLSA